MRVTYDVCQDPGERVVQVMILCTRCEFPQYVPLDESEMYTLAVPSFIAEGYDGYDFVADNAVNRQIGKSTNQLCLQSKTAACAFVKHSRYCH